MHIVIRASTTGIEFFSLETSSPEEAQQVYARFADLIANPNPTATEAEKKEAEMLRACRQFYNPASGLQNKIQAIKFVREQTGWGLKEAKDWVDRRSLRLFNRLLTLPIANRFEDENHSDYFE